MMIPETYNNLWGYTVNPYNRNLSVGGSSGGEAALLALRGVSGSIAKFLLMNLQDHPLALGATSGDRFVSSHLPEPKVPFIRPLS